MKKIIMLVLGFGMFFLPSIVKAESLDVEYMKNFGGNGINSYKDIVLNNDGSYVVVGSTYGSLPTSVNNGSYDAIIIKYDKDGNILWQKNYGGSEIDSFSSVVKTSDDGYVVAGYVKSTNIPGLNISGKYDGLLLKFKANGDIEWQKTYGGSEDESFDSIQLTSDGGFIAIGSSSSTIRELTAKGDSDALIVKFDENGNVEWEQNYGGNKYDLFLDVIQTDLGEYIAVGKTVSLINGKTDDSIDGIIVKYSATGDIIWEKYYGGASTIDAFNSVVLASNGGYVVAGYSFSEVQTSTNNGKTDGILIKYDKDGNILWQKNYGTTAEDEFNKIIRYLDNKYIIVGRSAFSVPVVVNGDSYDAMLVVYDENGNFESVYQIGSEGSYDAFDSVALSSDGNLFILGNVRESIPNYFTTTAQGEAIVVKSHLVYNISTSVSGSNGTISAGSNEIKSTEDFEITFTPTEGYEIDKVMVNATNDFTDRIQNNKLMLEHINEDLNVVVTYKKTIENPPTGDGIISSAIIGGVSLIGLLGVLLYLNKKKVYN